MEFSVYLARKQVYTALLEIHHLVTLGMDVLICHYVEVF